MECPSIPFPVWLLHRFEQFDQLPAITDSELRGGTLSFGDLSSRSRRLARGLQTMLRPGEIVLVYLPNTPDYACIFVATSLLGATMSGINPASSTDELRHYVTQTSARLCFCTADNHDRLKAQGLRVIVVGELGDSVPSAMRLDDLLANNETSPPSIDSFLRSDDWNVHEPLITPFSSGTSGLPKCVQLTHANYYAATFSLKEALFDELSAQGGDGGGGRRSTIAVLPFFHGSGFWALIYCLCEGHHTIAMRDFQPVKMMQLVAAHRVDTLNLVPAIVRLLVDLPLEEQLDVSCLRTVLCGSSSLGKQLSRAFLEKFPSVQNLIQGYGMTEVVVLSHITPLTSVARDDDDLHLGSCGRLLPGFQAKIVDVDTGEESDIGELLLRGPAVMCGYRNADEHERIVDADGWLHTGDVMRCDSDGYYFVVDRLKDLIKVNGLQVSPAEIEDVLLTHPAIREAGVVAHKTDSNECPVAFVALFSEACASAVDELELRHYVNERVSIWKRVDAVHVLSELPKSASGKVSRLQLRRRL